VDCPDKVEKELSRSALPYTSAAHLQIAMFSGGKNTPASMLDAVQVAQEFLRRLPRLADVFERDQSKMHVTQTVDYTILLTANCSGNPTTARQCIFPRATLSGQTTRHRRRNKSEHRQRSF
jgi:hypothetical protein